MFHVLIVSENFLVKYARNTSLLKKKKFEDFAMASFTHTYFVSAKRLIRSLSANSSNRGVWSPAKIKVMTS